MDIQWIWMRQRSLNALPWRIAPIFHRVWTATLEPLTFNAFMYMRTKQQISNKKKTATALSEKTTTTAKNLKEREIRRRIYVKNWAQPRELQLDKTLNVANDMNHPHSTLMCYNTQQQYQQCESFSARQNTSKINNISSRAFRTINKIWLNVLSVWCEK